MLYFMGCMFFSNFSCQPYVINIQIRNTDNICTDLYILLKPQSELGYLGCSCFYCTFSAIDLMSHFKYNVNSQTIFDIYFYWSLIFPFKTY